MNPVALRKMYARRAALEIAYTNRSRISHFRWAPRLFNIWFNINTSRQNFSGNNSSFFLSFFHFNLKIEKLKSFHFISFYFVLFLFEISSPETFVCCCYCCCSCCCYCSCCWKKERMEKNKTWEKEGKNCLRRLRFVIHLAEKARHLLQ